MTIAQEKQFENKIKSFLKENGCHWIKYWGGGQFTRAGVPDLICCVNGYYVAVEVKAQNGRPSELQLHEIRKIRKSGGFAFVLYPSGFEKFKKFILDLKDEKFNKEMEVIMK